MQGEESEGSQKLGKHKKIKKKETKADDSDIYLNHDAKEVKVVRKKQDKVKKKEVGETDVVELREERELDSLDIGANGAIEKGAAMPMKHEKKKKKTKENGDSEVSDGTDISVQDPKRTDVGKSENEGDDVCGKGVEKKKKKKEKRKRNSGREESSSSLELKEACKKGSSDGREANVEDVQSADDGGSRELGGNKDNANKRKREKAGFELETKQSSRGKKVKHVTGAESKENAKDGNDEMPSTSNNLLVKKKVKNGTGKVVKSSLDGTCSKEMHDREGAVSMVEKAGEDKVSAKNYVDSKKKGTNDRKVTESSKKTKKKVSFSGQVEVFPISKTSDHADGGNDPVDGNNADDGKDGLVRGKRFSLEEDEQVISAVENYIETNQLGEEGLNMVLNCKSFPQVRNCWKEIGTSLPNRPYTSVYYRAHILFERSKERKWDPMEYEVLKSFHEKHGPDWKTIAKDLGKHRFHVKDAWRRIKLPNSKKGGWSQDEYQALFDLVNLDLRLRVFEEKQSKHGMLRDNISWEAISSKMSTRYNAACCNKWYRQLTSPMVAEGEWLDSDDYLLVDALQKIDACCIEDVDWDNLIEHRSGEVCRKRWNQMIRHIGGHKEQSFVEQVDVISKRYRPEMRDYRD